MARLPPTSLTYVGPGTLNLRGSNIYTGGTNISAGNLNVYGQLVAFWDDSAQRRYFAVCIGQHN